MRKLLGLVTCVAALVGCDRKLGIAGATCTASADCADELQCIAATCVDPAAVARRRDADQATLDAEQAAAMAALMAELKQLKAEQDQLEQEKARLDSKLGAIIEATEKQRLLDEKAALDAQLAEKPAARAPGPRSKPRAKLEDPLAGL